MSKECWEILVENAVPTLCSALVGIVTAMFTIWITKKHKHKGKILIDAKIPNRPDISKRTWGFQENRGIQIFLVPLWLTISNSSGVSRVLRRVDLNAYSNGEKIAIFSQINGGETKRNGTVERQEFGNSGSYTFVAPANGSYFCKLFFGLNENKIQNDEKNVYSTCLTAPFHFE